MKIKRIDENGKEIIFNNIQEASRSIVSKLDNWKIQLYIVNAINNNIRAFKYKWTKI